MLYMEKMVFGGLQVGMLLKQSSWIDLYLTAIFTQKKKADKIFNLYCLI